MNSRLTTWAPLCVDVACPGRLICYGACWPTSCALAPCVTWEDAALLIGLADLSHVAWLGRLRRARGWLLWMLQERLAVPRSGEPSREQRAARVVLVDATRLKQPGGTGDDWRVHLAYDLVGGRFLDVRISDRHTAEGFTLFGWQPGDLVVGDRGYGRTKQVAWVRSQGANVVVRLAPHLVRMLDEQGHVLDVDAWCASLADGCYQREVCLIDEQGQCTAGRLIACALSPEAAWRARKKARRSASKRGQEVQEATLRLCGWLLLFTTLPEADWSPSQVLALYRARWQIELVIKRMKQVLKLAQLRGKTAATNEAVLLALLVSWSLQEQEVTQARQILHEAGQQMFSTPSAGEAQAGESLPAAVQLSTWGLVQLCVQTLQVSVQGVWTFARLQACWPNLSRFVCSRRHKRGHQESQIRQALLRQRPAMTFSVFSCSSA